MFLICAAALCNKPQFRLSRNIPPIKINFEDGRSPKFQGICCNPINKDIFLVDGESRLVIVLSTDDFESHARIAYRSQRLEAPTAVYFMSGTQTLLVCNNKDMKHQKAALALPEFSLVSLIRNGERWVEQSCVRLAARAQSKSQNNFFTTFCELSDSELLFGVELSTQLYRLRVGSSQQLKMAGEIRAPEPYHNVAAFVAEGGARVALTHYTLYVALYALRGERLEELSRLQFNGLHVWARVLWTGRLLLAEQNEAVDSHSVWELDVAGDRIARTYELCSSPAGDYIISWCSDQDTLITYGITSGLKVFHYEHQFPGNLNLSQN